MRCFGLGAGWSLVPALSLILALGGCAAPETVQRDIHVKRGVTLEDDLIHFYGAPSQRIIRGESEYFVYNGRIMNITSADGTSCKGTPVFIFSYDTKKLSDLKCREQIPAEDLSNKSGDSVVVGVTDSGNTPLYDSSSPGASGTDDGPGPQLAPSAGVQGTNEAVIAGPSAGDSVPVEDLGSGDADEGADGVSGSAGSGSGNGSDGTGDEIPHAGDDGGMEILNR